MCKRGKDLLFFNQNYYFFFLCSLVIYNFHMLGCNQLHIVFLSPADTALQNYRKKNTRHSKYRFKSVVGKFNLVVSPVGGIAHGFKRRLPHL